MLARRPSPFWHAACPLVAVVAPPVALLLLLLLLAHAPVAAQELPPAAETKRLADTARLFHREHGLSGHRRGPSVRVPDGDSDDRPTNTSRLADDLRQLELVRDFRIAPTGD